MHVYLTLYMRNICFALVMRLNNLLHHFNFEYVMLLYIHQLLIRIYAFVSLELYVYVESILFFNDEEPKRDNISLPMQTGDDYAYGNKLIFLHQFNFYRK